MKYKLVTLSPIHIGSGEKISPVEYVIDSKFNRIDMDGLFKDEKFNVNGFIEDAGFGSFYLGERYSNIAKKYVLYSLNISKDAVDYIMSRNSEIQEFIKTGGKPYIPGSSIKGAIRTAIMWYALKNDEELYFGLEDYVNKIWDRTERKPDKKWAGSKIEKMIFGKDPNHDLMRAFHISDTEEMNPNNLKIENVKILSTRKVGYGYKGFNSIVEALKKKVITNINIKIDDFLMKEKEKLGFNEKIINYLHDFGEICNEYAKNLIEYELNFFTKYNDGRINQIIDFYEGLYDEIENGILLRLAWGTGWHGMTVGTEIDEEIMDELRPIYDLGKIVHKECGGQVTIDRRNKGKFFCKKCRRGNIDRKDIEIVKPFPKTRKIVFENNIAKYPLGWIKLEEMR